MHTRDQIPWRLLASPPAGGASHMALDQTLLEAACEEDFVPTLRFYRWSPPALSIGRFQPIDDVDLDSCAAEGIEVTRRPTGGKSILHLDDFTYSIVMPRGFPLPDGVVEAYRLISEGILLALERLGLDAVIRPGGGEDYRRTGGACFAASTQADLECGGRKLCGSAQVRRGGALLQHGSILLKDQSGLLFRLLRFTGEEERDRHLDAYRRRCMSLDETAREYGWQHVADCFIEGFREYFGVEIAGGELSPRERARWNDLSRAYSSKRWLRNAESLALPR